MFQLAKKFGADDGGATAIEYALIALIVGLGIISGLQLLPNALDNTWNNVTGNM